MAISFVCKCGANIKTKDEHAGRASFCPACNAPVLVPDDDKPAVDWAALVNKPELEIIVEPPPLPRRPFWKDPIVVVGTTIPSVILLGFFGYLYRQQSAKNLRVQIYRLKTEADALARDKRTWRSAFDKYEEILAASSGRTANDPLLKKYVDLTQKARDNLYPTVRVEIERERARHEEEVEAAKLAADIQAEAARLAAFKADLAGGAWVVNKLGQSNVIRGLHVVLIPECTRAGAMADLLKECRNRAIIERVAYETMLPELRKGRTIVEGVNASEATRIIGLKGDAERATDEMLAMASERPMDVKRLFIAARSTAFGTDGIDRIVKDEVWDRAMSRLKPRESVTDIDGKYKLSGIAGGRYYIYARHATEYSVVEWLIPIVVDKSENMECDLFNEKAILIENKKD